MKSRSKGITLSYVYLIINMACGLFLSSYLIDRLGDTEYGIYKTVASFANYLILLEFGTGTVMTRNISMCRGAGDSQEQMNRNIATIWTVANILALIIGIASAIMYFCLDNIYKNSLSVDEIQKAKVIFIFIVVHLLLSFYIQTLSGIALGFEKYSIGSLLKTVRTVSRTVLLASIVLFLKYAVIIAIVDTLIALVELVYFFFYCKKNMSFSIKIRYFDKSIFLNILPLAIALFLQTIINQANNNVDSFLIGIFRSPEDVTKYSISLFIFSVFSSICAVPISMYAPQVAKEVSGGTPMNELSRKMASASKLTALVGGSILFGFIAAGKPFIAAIYGAKYLDDNVWLIAVVLMAPAFLSQLVAVSINVLDVLGKRLTRSLILMGTTVINIALTVWWLQIWGPIGAALATLVSYLVGHLIITNIYYYKAIKINIPYLYWQSFKCIIPCQIVAAVAGYFVGTLISLESRLKSVLALGASGGVYLVVFASLYLVLDKDAKVKVNGVLKKLLKKK